MNKELLDASVDVFDSLEKWNALFEIHKEADGIVEHWLTIGARAMEDAFNKQPSPGWVCEKWDKQHERRWYLAKFGPKSIGIGFGWPKWEFHLHAKGSEKFDGEKAVALLQTLRFGSLRAKFPENFREGGCFAGNTTFLPYGPCRDRKLQIAWYAAHKPKDFAEKMLAMVRDITACNELTELVSELNELSMR